MGKRHVDHDSALDTPTHKKRKTESSTHQTYVDHNATENSNQLASAAAAAGATATDVTYSLTTDVVDGVILTDLCAKQWRCGKPIGKRITQFFLIRFSSIQHLLNASDVHFPLIQLLIVRSFVGKFQAKAVLVRYS